jgi:ribulose-phosphate 3-epimerase
VLLMSVNRGSAAVVHTRRAAEDRGVASASCAAVVRPARVDGGIKTDNIGRRGGRGRDTFVAGSAIFGSKDYRGTICAMREQVAKGLRIADCRRDRLPGT